MVAAAGQCRLASAAGDDGGEERGASGGRQVAERPQGDDRAAWRTYWAAAGLPWHTEPEIAAERQGFLAERRADTDARRY
jgi:hypothetical protein